MPARSRQLGLFDTTMLVLGGIAGSGIFMNPHVVAREAPSGTAVLGAWLLGGVVHGLAAAGLYSQGQQVRERHTAGMDV